VGGDRGIGRLVRGGLLLAVPALAVLVPATAAAADFEYTYLDGGIQWLQDSEFDAYGTAFALYGSVDSGEHSYLFGGFVDGQVKQPGFKVDSSSTVAGGGVHGALSDAVDLLGEAAYLRARAETSFGSVTDSGYGVRVGLRAWAAGGVELNGGYQHVDFGDDATGQSWDAGTVLSFTETAALVLDVSKADETWNYSAWLRRYFP
jgi:hypothetical protein